jgi:predicted double-glycine peptidase
MNLWRRLRLTPALAGVVVCACLMGCATPQMTQLRATPSRDLPAAADLAATPFFAQKEYECGPAALAMLLTAAGVEVTPQALVEQVYLPARKGSLQAEMQAATRRHGLVAYNLAPRVQTLLQEVAAGHPVLVFQNVSLPIYPVWHYAVVIGYDLERNSITLHSGETARMEMSLFTFERLWARGSYWAMLALAPSQLPASADAAGYARSVAALESSHPAAAQAAYAAALLRWPGQAQLLLGLGNTAYALHQLDAAATAYAQAADAQADFADAWNNLAQARLELGQPALAAQAIARAVALGGVRLAQYLELQHQIDNSLGVR